MRFISTRIEAPSLSISEALQMGLASDGGLYVPEALPTHDWQRWDTHLSYAEFSHRVLTPFFAGDALESALAKMCQSAFNFPVPTVDVDAHTAFFELFHGPTLSFKDFGARFLAEALSVLGASEPFTMLVATSGDTGSAVAAAFHKKPNTHVVVLFPEGKISLRQQQQITCWGDNVRAISVAGSFDDCQKMVKGNLSDPKVNHQFRLNTANSINPGRLLPQSVYYAHLAVEQMRRHQQPVKLIVPSGNMGNVTAAYWAKAMGFPIEKIVISTNANRPVPDYLKNGLYEPRASIETLANAMDVGAPSNFERLQNLYPQFSKFVEHVKAYSVDDTQIKAAIVDAYQQHNILLCPHTATAYHVRRHHLDANARWVCVATADPAKFETIIEPLLDIRVPCPERLTALLERKHQCSHLASTAREGVLA